jgi:hypothetical protein
MRREPRGEAADIFSRFDRMFDEWARMMPFRVMHFPRWWEAAELGLTVSHGMLHIEAERREEERAGGEAGLAARCQVPSAGAAAAVMVAACGTSGRC